MIRPVVLLALFCCLLADDCSPLYWEVNPSYQVVTNEVELYTKYPLSIGSVNISTKQETISIVYSLNNITAKQTYDGSRVNVTGNGTGLITINNNLINLAFAYNANKTGSTFPVIKSYNGTGSAVLEKMQVNFTKQLIYRDGKATFELAKLNYNLPNAIQPSKFVPEPTAADNTTLFKLATDSMYDEIKKVIDVGLKSTLTNILANESFSNPFGGESYTYNFGSLNITFSSHMANVSFLEQGGLEVGYNMSIVGGTPVCSSFVPTDVGREASFITLELIQSIFGYAAANNSDWSSKVLNYSNTNSDVFQFYMIDLQDILPKALVDYPSLLTRTEARCGIQTGSTITLDAVYGMLRASVTWDCDLSIANTDIKLINVQPKINYDVKLTQQGNMLRSTVSNLYMTGVSFQPYDYPLQNEKLANLYLKSVIGTIGSFATVGTGFAQPRRTSPKFDWNSNFIRIYDLSKITEVRSE